MIHDLDPSSKLRSELGACFLPGIYDALSGVNLGPFCFFVLAASDFPLSDFDYPSEPVSEDGELVAEATPKPQPAKIEVPSLQGKFALVTGGGWNIGRAIALALARAGAKVMISSRNKLNLEETCSLAHKEDLDVRMVQADLTDPEDVERVFRCTRDAFGQVDILVNMAGGFGAGQPLVETDPKEWLEVVLRNFYTTYLCCREVLSEMMSRKQGDILTCAGGGAFFPLLGTFATAYASAKAAVCRFTDQLYAEVLGTPGIRINCIEPGLTLSPRDLLRIAEEEKQMGHPHPTRELNHDPEDGAKLALFLLSPAAKALNGRILSVDEDWWRYPSKVAYIAQTDLYRLRRTFETEA